METLTNVSTLDSNLRPRQYQV